MSAERKTSAPAAPLSLSATDSPPALKLRGGAPDTSPSEARGPGRKLSSLSSADAGRQRFAPPVDDEEMDHKLAQKLGISDSMSDGHISPSRTR